VISTGPSVGVGVGNALGACSGGTGGCDCVNVTWNVEGRLEETTVGEFVGVLEGRCVRTGRLVGCPGLGEGMGVGRL